MKGLPDGMDGSFCKLAIVGEHLAPPHVTFAETVKKWNIDQIRSDEYTIFFKG